MACILIIDDDDSFREALAEVLRDLGHDVVLTKSAQEAFEFINNADATFLDLKMPGVSGMAVTVTDIQTACVLKYDIFGEPTLNTRK